MFDIITYLLYFIQVQNNIILYLLFCLGAIKASKLPDEPIDKPYRKLKVDEMPIFDKVKKYDHKVLLKNYLLDKGKELKPVNSKVPVPESISCPCCGAPHIYIYDNNGGRGQFKCKVCESTFSRKNQFSKSVILRCPHCNKALEPIKDRKFFIIYKCKNNECSFYLKNKNSLSKEQKELFEIKPHSFKMHYIYRAFNINFKPLSRTSPVKGSVSLPRIYASNHVLGLVLTYYVNYGLSARKTAAIMKDIHQVDISHQTVLNYANTVSVITKPFVDNYPYELSDSICGDETYIRVNGKWHYIFFFFDAVKKIILSYHVSPNRDTPSAIIALDDVLSKFKEIPKNLNIIVDGNPIYLLAQHFFAQHDIFFDVSQVIGLTNDDPVSKEFRPLKQVIERLNRTFKGNYKSSHGFGAQHGSVTFVTLFAVYFNFLRPHASLEASVPVVIPELEDLPNMPARWIKLIQLSEEYISSCA
ncbi:DDE-type integrase/transposase/recombinase [Anaerosalibacter sp. Marseille-P3206]|uniref:DDE-type integrase/transposase/recombinase n=1 Tax=Anaerosalibacter sp. Marseille-P3206 TaxID=1871005 RepID=UPI0009854C99|nr:DDE-type integrase/transposase/recombinase [Anaerosalibacter sp. Marseille-P3206]